MYTEDLEGFEEAENTPPAFVSQVSQQDAEKLARENERLKKNLEKEKFFNKLLDQELKETKAEASTRVPADFVPANRGVSKGAFYTVLVLALALAGFVFYNYYYNAESSEDTASEIAPGTTDEISSSQENQLQEDAVAPVVKDTVPEIIAATPKITEPVKKTVVIPATSDENTDGEPDASLNEKPVQKAATPKTTAPPVSDSETTAPANTTIVAAHPSQPSRPVIATYRVTSKANFYNAPDENTLRSSFINGGNKVVDALDDQNGFIYVEYTNENGLLNRGWLSKKDLTQE